MALQSDLTKELLYKHYWLDHLKPDEIARRYSFADGRTIRKKMDKWNIPKRSLSEILTKKFKAPFKGGELENAYLLGLRAGDFHAKRVRKCIRVQTSTTHYAQWIMFTQAFRKYGECKCYLYHPKTDRPAEYFIYVDLHPSFDFLLHKMERLSDWLQHDEFFYAFMAAYCDCEANWHICKSREKVRGIFRLRTGDYTLLKQIKSKLIGAGLNVYMSLDIEKGTRLPYGIFRKHIFGLVINRRADLAFLAKKLMPFASHAEKKSRMRFVLENQGEPWSESQVIKVKNEFSSRNLSTVKHQEQWNEHERYNGHELEQNVQRRS